MGFQQITREFDLQFIHGGEIRVPAFGGDGLVMIPIPDEYALAQAGAGADHGARAMLHRLACLQHDQIFRAERFDAVADGLKVVDQAQPGEFELALELLAVDLPRQVGDLDALAVCRFP